MSLPLHDRIALVTGGGRGLGQAICHRLAVEGAHVVVADVNAETAQATAIEIAQQTERRTLAVQADVTDEAQVAAMVQRTLDEFGRLDLLVANAGILIAKPLAEFPLAEWQAVLDVNLTGYFLCAKHAARPMIEQRQGVIVQINSISGKRGSGGNAAYVASKWGGIGLTQSMAKELIQHNVRVNAVCPGHLLDSPLWVNSLYRQYAERYGISEADVRLRYLERIPMGRGCTYEDVCNVVVFLASDQSSYMTGQAINVSGGEAM